EVVRWLVQQQEVGIGEHQPRYLQATLLAAAQAPDGCVDILVGEEQAVQETDGLWLVQGLNSTNEIQRRAVKRQRFLFLGVIAYNDAGPDLYCAAIGRKHIHHSFEQRGFAAAVGSHDADALTVKDGEIKRLEE